MPETIADRASFARHGGMDGMGSRRHDGMDGMGSRRAPRLRALLGGMAAWTAWVLGVRRARAAARWHGGMDGMGSRRAARPRGGSAAWRHGRHGFSAGPAPLRLLGGSAAWRHGRHALSARPAPLRLLGGSAARRHGRHGLSARPAPARLLGGSAAWQHGRHALSARVAPPSAADHLDIKRTVVARLHPPIITEDTPITIEDTRARRASFLATPATRGTSSASSGKPTRRPG